MPSIQIELTDVEAASLKTLAAQSDLSMEETAKALVLRKAGLSFNEALERTFEKNKDLYDRLARWD